MKFTNDPELDRWTRGLPDERSRLVRLCVRLTGCSVDTAEDLAQEALFEAWRQAGSLRDPSAWRSFVSGVARNVCLRWQRSHYRELSRRAVETNGPDAVGIGAPAFLFENLAEDGALGIDQMVEREERADLLDRALGALPTDARSLLVERYVDEMPQAEMAARRGLTENAVGVRIHRAKSTLRRLLSTSPTLVTEAMAYGLAFPGDGPEAARAGWTPTRIWCPRCGRRQLEARYDRAADGLLRPGAPDTFETPLFGVRCPDCDRALGYDFRSAHPSINTRVLLQGVSGFKPALNRLGIWWGEYYDRAVRRQIAACPLCGRDAHATTVPPPGTAAGMRALRGLYIVCASCASVSCVSAGGVVFRHPAAQAFWRRHARLFLETERDVLVGGRSAVLVRLASRTSKAALEIALDRETFAPILVDETD